MMEIKSKFLVGFRIFFGSIMCFSMLRFIYKGWVDQLYIQPDFFFKYYGFSWIQALPGDWMYLPFILLAILGLMIALGLFYRVSSILFFFLFVYVELIDKSNYLNHYYFISLLSFLIVFMPLNRSKSIDVLIWPHIKLERFPNWPLKVLQLQVGLVYFFAGVAKLKSDWLFEAWPLKSWLANQSDFPVLGYFFNYEWTAYLFSCFGALFDLFIVFFLLNKKTRMPAYIILVIFHLLTWFLFNIGMFPWIMMGVALIFFDDSSRVLLSFNSSKKTKCFFVFYFLIQLFLPLRHFLYSGNVLWNEEGFRFAWHVMVMEKNAVVDFELYDPKSKAKWLINPKKYLKIHQYKQMSTQPDMILQFAHYLGNSYIEKGYHDIQVRAQSWAALNHRKTQSFIDPKVNLMKVELSLDKKSWIVPLEN